MIRIIHQNLIGFKKKRQEKKTKTTSKANTQSSSEYYISRTRIIQIL